ncbi:MAG TPA: hypothetical protein VN039_00005, partial [Nitrospira sp.]|nr:hypothetical protein [Nitrospira sp.]
MTSILDFKDVEIPEDNAPPVAMPEGASSYDPDFPGSTEEAPYGYKADGTPYKRRPNAGAGRPKGSGSKGVGKVGESQARAAAQLLGQLNSLVGMSLAAFGMPMTAGSIMEANV